MANPKKPPQIEAILRRNKVKLVAFLQNFHNDREGEHSVSSAGAVARAVLTLELHFSDEQFNVRPVSDTTSSQLTCHLRAGREGVPNHAAATVLILVRFLASCNTHTSTPCIFSFRSFPSHSRISRSILSLIVFMQPPVLALSSNLSSILEHWVEENAFIVQSTWSES